jgi:hypothetical protein
MGVQDIVVVCVAVIIPICPTADVEFERGL